MAGRPRPVIVLAAVLVALAGFAEAAAGRPARRVMNARVVAVDAAARTITVRGSGASTDTAFVVEPAAVRGLGGLKPGDRVVLTLRAGARGGPALVTRVVRAAAAAASTPEVASPRAERPPTDTVGPLRDPRAAPGADPRKNPLRDPRVVPGLSEPVPTPTPTPTPSPR
jgi:hypothetical protein